MLVGGESGVGPGQSVEPGAFEDRDAGDEGEVPRDHDVLDEQWDDGVPRGGPLNGHAVYDLYDKALDDVYDDTIDEACDDIRDARDTRNDVRDDARGDVRDDPGAPGAGDDADELPRLLARLGQLIAVHGPAGVVAMARSDADRRELTAYAAGWQDAAAEFAPRVAAARRDGWLGRWRPLRVLNGPGDVIPFPVARQYARPPQPRPAGDDLVGGWDVSHDAADDADPDAVHLPGHEGQSAPDAGPGPGSAGTAGGAGRRDVSPRPGGPVARADEYSAHGGRGEEEPGSSERPSPTRSHGEPRQQERSTRQTQGPPPSFPTKSRRSRAPTIPRLSPPQRLPGRGPDGTPPPDAPA